MQRIGKEQRLVFFVLPQEAAERIRALLLPRRAAANLQKYAVGVLHRFGIDCIQHLTYIAVVQIKRSAVDLRRTAEIGNGDVRIILFRQQLQQRVLNDHAGIERSPVGFPGLGRFHFVHLKILSNLSIIITYRSELSIRYIFSNCVEDFARFRKDVQNFIPRRGFRVLDRFAIVGSQITGRTGKWR